MHCNERNTKNSKVSSSHHCSVVFAGSGIACGFIARGFGPPSPPCAQGSAPYLSYWTDAQEEVVDKCLQVLRTGRTLQPEIHMMYEHDKYCLNDDEVTAS